MTSKLDAFKQGIYRKLRVPAGIRKLCDALFTAEKISYLIFGILTTIVNIAVYWVATNVFGIGYRAATVIAWLLAVAFAFFTNKFYVFKSKSVEPGVLLKEAVSFVLARVFSGVFDFGWMVLAVELIGMDDFIAKIASNIVVIVMNYFFSKLFIFRRKPQ